MNFRATIVLSFLICSFCFPAVSSGGIQFLSTPSSLQAPDGFSLLVNESNVQFAGDRRAFSFYFGGSMLGRVPFDLPGTPGSLDYAYLQVKSPLMKTDFLLGRMQIPDGIFPGLIDGLSSRTRFTGRTDLSLFAGKEVGIGGTVTGGRLSHRFGDRVGFGISFLDESGTALPREETVLDLRLHPFNKLTVSGSSSMDLHTGTWTGHSYSARLGPFYKATLLLDAAETVQLGQMYFGLPGPANRSSSIGAGVQYPLTKRLSLAIDARRTEDPSSGPVFSRGLRLFYTSSGAWTAGLSVGRREGENLHAFDMTVSLAKQVGNLNASLNLQQSVYDGDWSSEKNYRAASLCLGYQLSRWYRIAADLQEAITGTSRPDARAFLRLEFHFNS